MATKSFLKNINIKGSAKVSKLVGALENAQNVPAQEVSLSRPAVEVKGE